MRGGGGVKASTIQAEVNLALRKQQFTPTLFSSAVQEIFFQVSWLELREMLCNCLLDVGSSILMMVSFPNSKLYAFWGKRLCKHAGIVGHFSNHSLRATTATRGLQKGIPDKFAMERTGHGDFRSLQKYQPQI